jgi:hypothetical protein
MDLDRAAPRPEALDGTHDVRRQPLGTHEVEIRRLGMRVRHHPSGADQRAILELDPDRASGGADGDARIWRVGANLHAGGLGGATHRGR